MAFETPWFLKTKTSDVGRANQIVDERLQRAVTELEFKARKSLLKIDRQIDTVKEDFKNITDDVDFTTDLDQHGKPIDLEMARSKSSNDLRPLKTLGKIFVNLKGSKSAHKGYKIRQRKDRKKVTTQDILDKLAKMKEREMMEDWTLSPLAKVNMKRQKLKPIKDLAHADLTEQIEKELEKVKKVIADKDEILNGVVQETRKDIDAHVIGELKSTNKCSTDAEAATQTEKKSKKRKKKNKKKNGVHLESLESVHRDGSL